jgi:hypothetical protein
VHYINCGGRHGLLPCIPLDPKRPDRAVLVAFEDAADADFVAGCLRQAAVAQADAVAGGAASSLRGSNPGGAPDLTRPRTVSTSPPLLEDVAALQGMGVDVLPRGRMRHAGLITPEALTALLQEELAGPRPWGGPGRRGLAAPGRMPAGRAGAPRVDGAAQAGAVSGGFAPVSTDLPDLLLRSLGSLPGGMAAAAAVVADGAKAPEGRGGSEAEACDWALDEVRQEQTQQQMPASASSVWSWQRTPAQQQPPPPPQQQQQQQQQELQPQQPQQQQQWGEAHAPAPSFKAGEVTQQAPAEPGVAVPGSTAAPSFSDAIGLTHPAASGQPPDELVAKEEVRGVRSVRGVRLGSCDTAALRIPWHTCSTFLTGSPPLLFQDLLGEFYSLESAWRESGGAGAADWWGEDSPALEDVERSAQQQPAAQGPPPSSPWEPGSGAAGAGSGADLGAEVSRLEWQFDAVLRQREGQREKGSDGRATPAAAADGSDAAVRGLLSVHGQLQELQRRVGAHISTLSSREGLEEAGLVAGDGTIDRRAGLRAMVGMQDTLNGEPGTTARDPCCCMGAQHNAEGARHASQRVVVSHGLE